MLIGVTGKMMAGKDTFADAIIAELPFIKKYPFSKPMKDIVINTFGFTESDVYTQEGKEKTNPFWGITPRKLLQIIGTDMFRNVWRDDVWVKCAELFIEQHRDVIIPDVRFDNEAKMIKRRGGMVIKVIRSNLKIKDDHSSEKGLSTGIVDITINNDKTIADLQEEAIQTWKRCYEILSRRKEGHDSGLKEQPPHC